MAARKSRFAPLRCARSIAITTTAPCPVWVEGDREACRKAEAMNFVPGAGVLEAGQHRVHGLRRDVGVTRQLGAGQARVDGKYSQTDEFGQRQAERAQHRGHLGP